MKAFGGSEGVAPCIFYLGSRWRWVVSFTPQPLYPQGRSPWYPLDRCAQCKQINSFNSAHH